MYDRILINCNFPTMDPKIAAPFGAIEDGYVAIRHGRIVAVGLRQDLKHISGTLVDDLNGAWVTPGLVDCHTHLIFGGNRSAEFEQRLQGESYEEISNAGGGIRSTVNATREASMKELLDSAEARLKPLMLGGVTTIEIKSGYGLDTNNEIRMLEAAAQLGERHPVRVSPTILGLHALPSEYQNRRKDFVEMTIEEMIPAAAA